MESLGDGTSQIRNLYIAKYARKLKIIEKLGSGIRVAKSVLKENRLKPPLFEEQPTSFKVTLFRGTNEAIKGLQKSINLNEPRSLILQILSTQNSISKSDLVRNGIADRTASTYLAKLVSEGILKRFGNGPSTKYRLSAEDNQV